MFTCIQPCKQTTDCLVPYETCGQSLFNPNLTLCAEADCTLADLPCTGSPFTSTCVDIDGEDVDVCYQSGALGVGERCDASSRQQGEFCAVEDACVDGICRPICDAANGNAGCAAGQLCITDYGSAPAGCAPTCDYTVPDASVCSPAAGAPQRCYTPFVSPGLTDSPVGFCAGATANPLPEGALCPANNTVVFPDPCASGTACFFGFCQRLCEGVGGQDDCPTGMLCTSIGQIFGQPQSHDVGFCAQTCDYTSTDPGTCPPTAGGVPQRCYPSLSYGLPDGPLGICGYASTSLPVGATCYEPFAASPDPCATGEFCLGTCHQVCRGVGTQATCPAGETCGTAAVYFGIPPSYDTQFGYCQ